MLGTEQGAAQSAPPLECFVIPAARSCSSMSGLLFCWLLLDKNPHFYWKCSVVEGMEHPPLRFPTYAKSWLPF